jgi:histone deacetylase 1/2
MDPLWLIQVSFHKYGEFFPGTGALDDIGYGKGGWSTDQDAVSAAAWQDSNLTAGDLSVTMVQAQVLPASTVCSCNPGDHVSWSEH